MDEKTITQLGVDEFDEDESALTVECEVANMIEATKRHFGEVKAKSKPGIYKGELVYLPLELLEKRDQAKKDSVMTQEETITALWEIVQKVATEDTIYGDDFGDHYCIFCSGDQDYADPENYKHEPHCIVLKARALVAQDTQQH